MFDDAFLTRFWCKVDRRGADECWPWLGAKNPDGYGNIGHRGKMLGAHRVSYAIKTGRRPGRRHVRHRCDNPSCVNPTHLVAGNHQMNMADMARKGRRKGKYVPRMVGEMNPQSKLTRESVANIRALKGTTTLSNLARKHGVSISLIWQVQNNLLWIHEPC